MGGPLAKVWRNSLKRLDSEKEMKGNFLFHSAFHSVQTRSDAVLQIRIPANRPGPDEGKRLALTPALSRKAPSRDARLSTGLCGRVSLGA